MAEPATPRRFRRRLLGVMVLLGLLPLVAWGLVSRTLTGQVLSLRPAQLESLLSRLDEHLPATPAEAGLREELAAARVHLVQGELTRRSLARLMPRLLLLTSVVSAALLGGTALFVGRQLARPVELLAEGMARYARGDLEHRLPSPAGARPDELQFLVRQFNRMGDELAAQRARLEVTENLAAWQGVARALAHELKNPLTAMRMAVGRLARSAPGPQEGERTAEAIALIEGQIDTLLRLAQSFSAFARLPAPEPRSIEFGPLLADVCALYRQTSPVPVEEDVPPGIELQADPGLLSQALGNLVKNAVEASPAGGAAVRVAARVDGDRLQIEVADRGRGIGAVLEGTALARSLGTTKAQGSGLGLPIAHKIVHEHGGTLRLEPRPEGGTLAVVSLPRRSRG